MRYDMHSINGYMDGYLQKTAGGLSDWLSPTTAFGALATAYKGGTDVGRTLLPWLMVAPVLIGAGAGTMHARLTSPTKMDIEAMQKAMKLAEVDEFASDMARRRDADKMETAANEQKKEVPGERSLHV